MASQANQPPATGPTQSSYNTARSDHTISASLPRADGTQDLTEGLKPRGRLPPGSYEDDSYTIAEQPGDFSQVQNENPLLSSDDDAPSSLANITKQRGKGGRPRARFTSNVPESTIYPSMSAAKTYAARDPSFVDARDPEDLIDMSDAHDQRSRRSSESLDGNSERVTAGSPGAAPKDPTFVFRRPEIPVKAPPPFPTEQRRATSFVKPIPGQPNTLGVYHVDETGTTTKQGELNRTSIEEVQHGEGSDQTKVEQLSTWYNICMDTVTSLNQDLEAERLSAQRAEQEHHEVRKTLAEQLAQEKDRAKIAEDESDALTSEIATVKGQLADADGKVVQLNENLSTLRAQVLTHRHAEQQAEAGKKKYKNRYINEWNQHKSTREESLQHIDQLDAEIATLTAQLRKAQRNRDGPPGDSSSDSDSERSDSDRRGDRRRSSRDHARRNRGRDHRSSRRDRRSSPSDRSRSRSRSTYRHPKQQDPAEFSGTKGTDTSEYLKWKLDVLAWFKKYHKDFKHESDQLAFLRQKTKGSAWGAIMHGWIVAGGEFTSSKQAWDILDTIYQPVNTQQEAHAWYNNSQESRMRASENMSEYLARFNVKVAPIGWDDKTKIFNLNSRLPSIWQERMLGHTVTMTSFNEFCSTLRHLEQALPYNLRHSNKTGGGGGGSSNVSTSHASINNSSNTNRSAGRGGNTLQGRQYSNATKIGSNPFGRTRVERQVLFEIKSCFKCLEPGHTADKCPNQEGQIVSFPKIKAAVDAGVDKMRKQRVGQAAVHVHTENDHAHAHVISPSSEN